MMIDRASAYNSPGYLAQCQFCGDWLRFQANPNHTIWMKREDYAKAKIKRRILCEYDKWLVLSDPITDNQARLDAKDLDGGPYLKPKACERCLADVVRRKPGSGRPGVGVHEELIPVNGESE